MNDSRNIVLPRMFYHYTKQPINKPVKDLFETNSETRAEQQIKQLHFDVSSTLYSNHINGTLLILRNKPLDAVLHYSGSHRAGAVFC